MAGTKLGGKRAAKSIKSKFGDDFYQRIGRIGGKNGNTGGFAARKQCYCDFAKSGHIKARCAGQKGGTISRRYKNVTVSKPEARKNLIARILGW